MAQLKEAMANNFGYACNASAPAATADECTDEARIYEAVKRILSNNGSINLADLQAQLAGPAQACRWPSPAEPAKTEPACVNPDYAHIKRLMENTPWFGNDIDEVDMIARRCGQIYSYEVENTRIRAADSSRLDAILYLPMCYSERM